MDNRLFLIVLLAGAPAVMYGMKPSRADGQNPMTTSQKLKVTAPSPLSARNKELLEAKVALNRVETRKQSLESSPLGLRNKDNAPQS
jgi:hypothetical protein